MLKKIHFPALLLAAALLVLPALSHGAAAAQSGEGWLIAQTSADAGTFSDVPESLAFAPAIRTACQAGLMEGYASGRFQPKGTLTNAQITAVAARLYDLLTGGDGKISAVDSAPWYQGYYARLAQVLGYDDFQALEAALSPTELCTRPVFTKLLSGVLGKAGVTLPVLNAVTGIPDVDPVYSSSALTGETLCHAALTLYNAGIMRGSDSYGTLGSGSLTRGAAAAMLARLIDPAQRLTFTLKSLDLCRDILGLSPDTVLFTVDGTPISAEVFAPTLVGSLLQWGKDSTAKAETDALRLFCAYDESVFAVARAKGIALSETELQKAASFGAAANGYLGAPAACWERMDQRTQLNLKLENAYCAEDEKTGAGEYHTALEHAGGALTITPSKALKSLNLKTVYTRAAASPYSQWRSNPN
jgi:hypothetical protein